MHQTANIYEHAKDVCCWCKCRYQYLKSFTDPIHIVNITRLGSKLPTRIHFNLDFNKYRSLKIHPILCFTGIKTKHNDKSQRKLRNRGNVSEGFLCIHKTLVENLVQIMINDLLLPLPLKVRKVSYNIRIVLRIRNRQTAKIATKIIHCSYFGMKMRICTS